MINERCEVTYTWERKYINVRSSILHTRANRTNLHIRGDFCCDYSQCRVQRKQKKRIRDEIKNRHRRPRRQYLYNSVNTHSWSLCYAEGAISREQLASNRRVQSVDRTVRCHNRRMRCMSVDYVKVRRDGRAESSGIRHQRNAEKHKHNAACMRIQSFTCVSVYLQLLYYNL